MISVFVEAALRSLLVGLAVAVGLRIFRISNVLARKAAWSLVLVSAFALPLLLPVTAQWHLLPAKVNVVLPAPPSVLLEELQARIGPRMSSGSPFSQATASLPQSDFAMTQGPRRPEHAEQRASETASRTARVPHSAKPDLDTALRPDSPASSPALSTSNGARSMQEAQVPAPVRHTAVLPIIVALVIYCAVAALLLFRLALGMFTTIQLWQAATPISAGQLPFDAASLQVRASSKIASPVTIGSAVLLPADYTAWDSEKLRIVLAHERSHIRQGDFYLQLLASIYAALVWFSPLGWWLKHELAELAEAISDRAGIEEAASRAAYAQILLEFAATPRRIYIGVAMARPGSLSRRIERLLNDHSFRQCFAGGRRALLAITLVPVALFASTALVRVQAAPATKATEPGDTGLRPLPPATASLPAVLPESQAPESEPASEMIASAAPEAVVPTAAEGSQEGGTLSFERTLSVSDAAQLAVTTGSGDIHIKRGSGNQIHIQGQIHVSHEGSEEQARQIAANPPIEQTGDSIRVGQHPEQWRGISINYEIEAPAGTLLTANSGSGNIVDEGVGKSAKLQTGSGDISATSLEGPFTVKTGSGNIVAAQTGEGDVVAETGSGDIELKDIHGSFHGQTGSGEIKASGTPSASWTLHTGSGNIELWTGNAPLTLDASTGSGSVTTEHEMLTHGTVDRHHVQGTLNGGGPTLRAQTGSGDIQIH